MKGWTKMISERRRAVSTFALVAAVSMLTASVGVAQTSGSGENSVRGYEYEGPYVQFGVSVGQIDFDRRFGPQRKSSDNNASGGFTMTGGYRFLPWISGEFNFTYLGGGSVDFGSQKKGDGRFFAFTFGPKIYPLGAFPIEEFPEIIQPYALIQIGGGEFEIDNTNFDESAFVARFILGMDIWATDNVGFFVEGGGHASSEDDVDGVGIFTVGAQYRF